MASCRDHDILTEVPPFSGSRTGNPLFYKLRYITLSSFVHTSVKKRQTLLFELLDIGAYASYINRARLPRMLQFPINMELFYNLKVEPWWLKRRYVFFISKNKKIKCSLSCQWLSPIPRENREQIYPRFIRLLCASSEDIHSKGFIWASFFFFFFLALQSK